MEDHETLLVVALLQARVPEKVDTKRLQFGRKFGFREG